MINNKISFKILIIFTCLSLIGLSLIPYLNLRLNPSQKTSIISVSFTWPGTSSRIIEKEVTSKLEGVLGNLEDLNSIESYTNRGHGLILLKIDSDRASDSKRFEISSLIRQVFTSFPEGVNYPIISLNNTKENESVLLSYSINSFHDFGNTDELLKKTLDKAITNIEGVSKTAFYGLNSYDWQIKYDINKLNKVKLSVSELSNILEGYLSKQQFGIVNKPLNNKSNQSIWLTLSYFNKDHLNLETIPLIKIKDRFVFLKDVATIEYTLSPPSAYYRLNGLETYNLVVYARPNINNIKVANDVKSIISELKLPNHTSLKLTQDNTKFLVKELDKIKKRSFYSILLLVLLIVLVYREYKYLVVLTTGFLVNIFVSIVLCYMLGVELNIYSLVGITIALGIILDNTLVMIDHVRNYQNKKVFLAILSSTVTTIGGIGIVLFSNEKNQGFLRDLGIIISINLIISLIVAYYFIPALIFKIKLSKKTRSSRFNLTRKVVKFKKVYSYFIDYIRRPLLKRSLIVVLILGFGIPLNLLPELIEGDTAISKLYNSTIGHKWFADNVRPTAEKVIGGSLYLFSSNIYDESVYTSPKETALTVKGVMPEGGTIEQLNTAIVIMEQYISSFKNIDFFETNIIDPRNSSIRIFFKNNGNEAFPYDLKNKIETYAIQIGGVDWSVFGVGRGFSNALNSKGLENTIVLKGYNYDILHEYAQSFGEIILEDGKGRVSNISIGKGNNGESPLQEFNLVFKQDKLNLLNLSQSQAYEILESKLYSKRMNAFTGENKNERIQLISKDLSEFDIWSLNNEILSNPNRSIKFGQFSSFGKKRTGSTIHKLNQEYILNLSYKYIGTSKSSKFFRKYKIKEFSSKLPFGFKVEKESSSSSWNVKDKEQYYFLLVGVLIIYFICAILLESLVQPFIVISTIPISFIGVFLTFYTFNFNFDQGGYICFILLIGLSINASLYIINDFNNLRLKYPKRHMQTLFVNAFMSKITPIILTIFTTIVSLMPFLWDANQEVFWFSFAAGTIGGLIFSIIAWFIYLPLFMKFNFKTS